MQEAQMDYTPRFAEPGKGSGIMRKTLLVFLAILSVASTLSGCFYHYHDDWDDRGYRRDGRYYGDRDYDGHPGYDGHRDGYRDSRDYRERR
jgi:hypothetical protein